MTRRVGPALLVIASLTTCPPDAALQARLAAAQADEAAMKSQADELVTLRREMEPLEQRYAQACASHPELRSVTVAATPAPARPPIPAKHVFEVPIDARLREQLESVELRIAMLSKVLDEVRYLEARRHALEAALRPLEATPSGAPPTSP